MTSMESSTVARHILTLATFWWILCSWAGSAAAVAQSPSSSIGSGGILAARFDMETQNPVAGSSVRSIQIQSGPGSESNGTSHRWLSLRSTKGNGETFQVWCQIPVDAPAFGPPSPASVRRYLVQSGNGQAIEYRHEVTGAAVLPSIGGWSDAWPRSEGAGTESTPQSPFPPRVRYLGHVYRRTESSASPVLPVPPSPRVFSLRPDLWIGVPSNQRTRDDVRRYDGSDYEMIRLTRDDYQAMAAAGMTCVRVDAQQRPWIEDLPIFYWGVPAAEIPFPESLYDPRYLGPSLFIDEPAVHTRDFVIRPQLTKDPSYRTAINPRLAFQAFQETFRHAWQEGAAQELLKGLKSRTDVDLGSMAFAQANLYSWETMISTAAYQLSQDPVVPSALVFEPPGRIGTQRTLPEFNMTYGCQIPVDDPKHFTSILYGFLRGAARLTGKQWGTSIYGAVDRADAPWFLTHAYDLGATRFFFWDNYQLACVPYSECLDLSRQLRRRAENRPARDLDRLRNAAEIAILLPPGYNLGHVSMGRGNLWGVPELNLERKNEQGIRYREVMGQFFIEIERCLRLGIAFDLLWDLPNLPPKGYRETIRIREDGKVEVTRPGQARPEILAHARTPERPNGAPPKLAVELSTQSGRAPLSVHAVAKVEETSAPIYYTHGTDPKGEYHNAVVAWELYGPHEEDHRSLAPARMQAHVAVSGTKREVAIDFVLDRPGDYRLRAATVDLAGRTAVEWISLRAEAP